MRDVRLLLDFAAVADALSFTAAAVRLGVPQPWLSARIRKLEALFGAALFERSTRSVRLTPAGMQLFEQVRPLAEVAETVLAETERLRLGQSGRLRIGCPQLGEPDRRQAELISRFALANPDIQLEVEPGSVDFHLDLLHRGMLDFVMTVVAGSVEPVTGLEAIPLHRLSLAVMMHADDPLVQVDPLMSAALAGRRLATFSRHRAPAFHDMLYASLLASGIEPVVVPELRRSLLRGAPDLIVSTVVPAPADAQLRHGIVRRTIIDGCPLWLALFCRKSNARSRAAQLFWSFALAAADAHGTSTGQSTDYPAILANRPIG